MGDRKTCYVLKSLQDLIRVKFNEIRIKRILLDDLIKIVTIVVHDNVQVFRVSFMSEEVILHFEDVGMIQHFQNLQLSIFILFIL